MFHVYVACMITLLCVVLFRKCTVVREYVVCVIVVLLQSCCCRIMSWLYVCMNGVSKVENKQWLYTNPLSQFRVRCVFCAGVKNIEIPVV